VIYAFFALIGFVIGCGVTFVLSNWEREQREDGGFDERD